MHRFVDRIRLLRGSVFAVSLSLTLTAALDPTSPAFALSELQQVPGQHTEDTTKDTPADDGAATEAVQDEGARRLQLPMPDPLIRKDTAEQEPAKPDTDETVAEPETPVEVIYDIDKVPQPVRRMRELIVEAAASGDIERLRPLLGKGPTQTQVSVAGGDDDPVTTLKGLSGDPDGTEILAILLDVLVTGFVKVDAGTPNETYVWPYFTEKSLDNLSPPEKVELLRIVTAGDFADMQEFGGYNFYRVGISPDGQWKFFVAGD